MGQKATPSLPQQMKLIRLIRLDLDGGTIHFQDAAAFYQPSAGDELPSFSGLRGLIVTAVDEDTKTLTVRHPIGGGKTTVGFEYIRS